MASTLQMTGPLTPADEATIAGVRRSRLSLHLNTPRSRRWLLVQLVSIPVGNVAKARKSVDTSVARTETPRKAFGGLVDEFMTSQALRRCM